MKGMITDYMVTNSFGYLTDEEEDEYCFYSGDVNLDDGQLKKGDQVSFDLYRGRGTRAVNVRKKILE